jgi:hypothetical protein
MLTLVTPFKTDNNKEQKTDSTHSQREHLSSIDRYNLMYVKYNGNPPHSPEDLAKELKLSSKKSTEIRTLPQSTIVKKMARKSTIRK